MKDIKNTKDIEVFAAQCDNCGKISYPTHFYCPQCGHTRFTKTAITGPGRLLTFTRVYNLAVDFCQRFVTLGIVELDMGIRALGHVHAADPKPGMRVEAKIETVRIVDGKERKGVVFHPVK
ncbi:OB-fold domain-containing protein [bacterium]|nr:OB-fold domain-containing protein [candidate division CSSED10-310 bacterium]